VAVALVLLLSMAADACGAAQASAGPTTTAYYLSLGDSLAAGWQPTPTDPIGQVTDRGYADDLWRAEQRIDRGLRLVKLGCPGETTQTMLQGGICRYAQGSQEAAAVAFLRAHRSSTAFVTLDIGANDVDGCAPHDTVDIGCVETGLHEIQTQLPAIVGPLRAAGGPDLRIVGMNLYDPFLADYLNGPAGQQVAKLSVSLLGTLDGLLAKGFATIGAPTADVTAAFHSTDVSSTTPLAGHGTVPVAVAAICHLTWMCAAPPFGPNIHANDAGYEVMARTLQPLVAGAVAHLAR